jgi:hypothetical protein
MDGARFDALVRSIETAVPRRSTLTGVFCAGLAVLAFRLRMEDSKANHKKKKKKCKGGKKKCGKKCFDLQTDATHCGSCDIACGTGEFCLDGDCLVGIGTCEVGDDFCLNAQDKCNDFDTCECHVSFTGETRCASFPEEGFTCKECTTDAECAERGPGAFCAKTTGNSGCHCIIGQGFCLVPCVFDASGN